MSKTILSALTLSDIDEIVLAFKTIGWNKPATIYLNYLQEQYEEKRLIFLAKINKKFAGYITLNLQPHYSYLKNKNIPEIADLNVLPSFRQQGIGTYLINHCEKIAKEKNNSQIGLGVGLTADYSDALRLYIKLAYQPDGQGISYQNTILKYGDYTNVNDDLLLHFIKTLKN